MLNQEECVDIIIHDLAFVNAYEMAKSEDLELQHQNIVNKSYVRRIKQKPSYIFKSFVKECCFVPNKKTSISLLNVLETESKSGPVKMMADLHESVEVPLTAPMTILPQNNNNSIKPAEVMDR